MTRAKRIDEVITPNGLNFSLFLVFWILLEKNRLNLPNLRETILKNHFNYSYREWQKKQKVRLEFLIGLYNFFVINN
jgi:hypothetical protein